MTSANSRRRTWSIPLTVCGSASVAVNWEQGFFDVEVLNPHNRILGYQFDVNCGIQQAVSLVDPLEYMIQPEHALGGTP